MPDKIVVKDLAPYDGEYPFEGDFTMRELHTIKRISGIRAGELDEALNAGDTDILVAITVIAMERAGQKGIEDDIWNAKPGSITYVGEAEPEADVRPPE